MSFFHFNIRKISLVVLSILAAMSVIAVTASAATNISTNIQTDGTLSVTGTSTLGTLTITNYDYNNLPSNIVIGNGETSACPSGDFPNESNTVTIGGASTANANCIAGVSVIIGANAQASGTGNDYYQTIIGYNASSTGSEPTNTIKGAQTQSSAYANVVIGTYTKVSGGTGAGLSTAVGYQSLISNTRDIALGSNVTVTGANSANIGGTNLTVANANTFSYGVSSTLHGFGTLTPQNRVDISGAAARALLD